MLDKDSAVEKLEKLPNHIKEKIDVCPFYGCWLFTGEVNNCGYSRFWCWGIRFLGHVFSYEYFNRPLLHLGRDNLDVHHKCNTRNCINPNHLEAIPHKKNCWYRDNPQG